MKKFCFFIPGTFEKAQGNNSTDKYKNMLFKGIASTPNLGFDKQGQKLMPNGFDTTEFLNKGYINYHHLWKKTPSTIIGEPIVATITKNNEFYIEGKLFPNSDIARDVYDLANVLEKDSATRRLGFSVEGEAVEYDKDDENVITKARITNVAITPCPVCPGTEMQIIKGGFSDIKFELDEGKEFLMEEDGDGFHWIVDKNLEIKKSFYENNNVNNKGNLDKNENIHKDKNVKKVKMFDFMKSFFDKFASDEHEENKNVTQTDIEMTNPNELIKAEAIKNEVLEMFRREQDAIQKAKDAEFERLKETKIMIDKAVNEAIAPIQKALGELLGAEINKAQGEPVAPLPQMPPPIAPLPQGAPVGYNPQAYPPQGYNPQGYNPQAYNPAYNPQAQVPAPAPIQKSMEQQIADLTTAFENLKRMPQIQKAMTTGYAERFPGGANPAGEAIVNYSANNPADKAKLAAKINKAIASEEATVGKDPELVKAVTLVELGIFEAPLRKMLYERFKANIVQ